MGGAVPRGDRRRHTSQLHRTECHAGHRDTPLLNTLRTDASEEGQEPPPRPLQGALPTPSHCSPDAKCQPQWHL